MTCEIEGLMWENEIKQLTKEYAETKAQGVSLPPYHQASEWATGLHAIAVNTPCDALSSPEEEFC